ncbi:TetR/AcrR family transcriptional regulator [Alloalcanivorax sp. C16-1]|uniref:TetR/AcrR family transcriptional regulator n=1 Tax=Alloalcanivorax sp. C16-1 TaxID=3390051 RepID=UPI0039707E05
MPRPREFDETRVLDAAMHCFWHQGYESTSVRTLARSMNLTSASLYNTFGDKRTLYQQALARYVQTGFEERVRRFEQQPPRAALRAFFEDVVERSLRDDEHKGCLLVNSALELAPHDPDFQRAINAVLRRVEAFFLRCAKAGQRDGSIADRHAATDLARFLLGVLMGIRVLARTRPEPALLRGLIKPALALLDDDA